MATSSSSSLHRLWVGQLVRDQSSCDRGIALYERRPIPTSLIPTSSKGKQKEVVAPLPPVVQQVARRTTRSHSASLPTPPSSQRPALSQPSTSSRTIVPSPTEQNLIVIGQESSPPIKKSGQRRVSNDRRGALPPSSPPSQPTALLSLQPDQSQVDEEEDAERLSSLLEELLDERLEAKLKLVVLKPQPLSALEAAHIHLRSVDSDLLQGIEFGNDGPPAEWPYDSSATGRIHKLLKTGEVDGRTSHFLEYRVVVKGDDLNFFSRATRALVYGWGGSLETREMRLFVKILTREELLRFKGWGPDAPSPIPTLVNPPTQGSLSRSPSEDKRSSPSNSNSLLVNPAPEEDDVLSQSQSSDSAPPPPQRSLYKNPHDRNRPLKDRLVGVRLPVREGVWSRPSTSSSRNKGKQREVQRPPSPARITWPPRVGLKRTGVELEPVDDWENRKRTKKDVRDGGVDSWRETVDRMTSSAEKSKAAQKGKGRASKSSGKRSGAVPPHVEVIQNPPPETNGQINRRTVASVTLAQVLAFEERGGTRSNGMLQATSGAACYALRSVIDGGLLSREAVGPTVANVLFLFALDCEKDKLAVRSEFAYILAGQVPPTLRTKEKSTANDMEVDELVHSPAPSPVTVELISVSVVPELKASAVDQEMPPLADALALPIPRQPTPIPEAPLTVELGKPSLYNPFHLAYPELKLPRIHDPIVDSDDEQPASPVEDRTTDLRSPLALPSDTAAPPSDEAFVETNLPPPCEQVPKSAVAPDNHSPIDPLPNPRSPSPVAKPPAETLAPAHVPEVELPPAPIDIPLVEDLSAASARSPTPPVLQETVPVPETRPPSPAPTDDAQPPVDVTFDTLLTEAPCAPEDSMPEPQAVGKVVPSPFPVMADLSSIDSFADDSDSDLTSVGSDDEGYDLEGKAAEEREHIEEEEWVNSQPCSPFADPFLRGSSPLTPAPSPAPPQQSVDPKLTPFRRTLRSSAGRHLDSTVGTTSSSSVKSSALILTPMDQPRQGYSNATSSGTLPDFTPPPRRSARRASVLKPLRLSPTTPATSLPSPPTTTLTPTVPPASPAEASVEVKEEIAEPDDEEEQVDLGASFVETIGRHGEKVYLLSRRSREGTALSQGSSYRS